MRLLSDVTVTVEYRDGSRFGSTLSRRCGATVQRALAPLGWSFLLHGPESAARTARECLRAALDTAAFQAIARVDGGMRWRLRDAFVYPEDAAPAALVIGNGARGVRISAGASDWPALCDAVAGLASPLDATLLERGLAAPAPAPAPALGDLTFVGHNTVVVRSATTRILIDPWLLPASPSHPPGYQPLQASDLGPMDAILITHSHPDHFDAGTLLRFPRDVRVVVPRVPRESVLSLDMERRLRELGFERVTAADWWETLPIGDFEVAVLPFHGEQPTDGEVVHPEVRNCGNTYLLRGPSFSAAFLADSGRDGAGDVREVAARARARWGAVDVLFSGYRGWRMRPIDFLRSSVERYLLFVPPPLWTVPQQLMTDVPGTVELARAWGARFLAPYGDGGAPWYWERGLGPRLDRASPREDVAVDPFPERVVDALRASGLACRPLLLRPGDGLQWEDGRPRRVRLDGHRWPFGGDPP